MVFCCLFFRAYQKYGRFSAWIGCDRSSFLRISYRLSHAFLQCFGRDSAFTIVNASGCPAFKQGTHFDQTWAGLHQLLWSYFELLQLHNGWVAFKGKKSDREENTNFTCPGTSNSRGPLFLSRCHSFLFWFLFLSHSAIILIHRSNMNPSIHTSSNIQKRRRQDLAEQHSIAHWDETLVQIMRKFRKR